MCGIHLCRKCWMWGMWCGKLHWDQRCSLVFFVREQRLLSCTWFDSIGIFKIKSYHNPFIGVLKLVHTFCWSTRRSQYLLVSIGKFFYCTQPPHAGATKLFCPHHKGACSPHPIRVGGPDLYVLVLYWHVQYILIHTSTCNVAWSFPSDSRPRDLHMITNM